MKKKIIAIVIAAIIAIGAILYFCTPLFAPKAPEVKTYKVGVLQLVQHAALDAATKGFKDVLTEKLGDTVKFDEANANGESDICNTIANGFVSNGMDLIFANATPALQACVSATNTIPIVGTSVTDYGTALANPEMDPAKGTGVNVTGTSDGVPAQYYADVTMELVPAAKKVAVLYCSSEPNSVLQADQYIECMKAYNVECVVNTFADSNDLQAVVTAAVEGVDAMYIPTDNTAASNMTLISGVTIPANLPIIAGEENMTKAGAMATISISYYDIGRVAGEMAYEILVNGADITKMPIGYAADPVKEYNADYAASIGFTMPETYAPIQ